MSQTPRTDAEERLMRIDCDDSCAEIYVLREDKKTNGLVVLSLFARQLETELNEAKQLPHAAKIQAAEDDAARLAESLRECRGECDRLGQEGIRERADKALEAHESRKRASVKPEK